MRKDDGNHRSWCKHSSNEYGSGGGAKNRRLINKRTRIRAKAKLARDHDNVQKSACDPNEQPKSHNEGGGGGT